MEGNLGELLKSHKKKKDEIKKSLEQFKKILSEPDERVFAELAFCLCTPQSKAIHCWKAVESLNTNKLLYTGEASQIKPFLNAVRFNENKSQYIVEARKIFSNDESLQLRKSLQKFKNGQEARDWFVENVNGMGMKEASHFLRNIGFSFELAILDVHILKNLEKYGVIGKIPKSLTKKVYLEIEDKMKKFAEQIGIPFAELDLLFWSGETGFIFK